MLSFLLMPKFIDLVIKYYQQIKDFLLLLLDKILLQSVEKHESWENLTFAMKYSRSRFINLSIAIHRGINPEKLTIPVKVRLSNIWCGTAADLEIQQLFYKMIIALFYLSTNISQFYEHCQFKNGPRRFTPKCVHPFQRKLLNRINIFLIFS